MTICLPIATNVSYKIPRITAEIIINLLIRGSARYLIRVYRHFKLTGKESVNIIHYFSSNNIGSR